MRRPTSALVLVKVFLGTTLAATTVSAQQTSAPPPPGGAPPAVDTAFGTTLNAARGSRTLLRNGWDYITYQEYERALAFFREAEARQGELSAPERTKLRQGIERAQRGLREAANGMTTEARYARSNPGRRPGAFALATPAASKAGPAIAPLVEREPIQLTSGPNANRPNVPTPAPAAAPAPIMTPAPIPPTPVVEDEPQSVPPVENAPAAAAVLAPAAAAVLVSPVPSTPAAIPAPIPVSAVVPAPVASPPASPIRPSAMPVPDLPPFPEDVPLPALPGDPTSEPPASMPAPAPVPSPAPELPPPASELLPPVRAEPTPPGPKAEAAGTPSPVAESSPVPVPSPVAEPSPVPVPSPVVEPSPEVETPPALPETTNRGPSAGPGPAPAVEPPASSPTIGRFEEVPRVAVVPGDNETPPAPMGASPALTPAPAPAPPEAPARGRFGRDTLIPERADDGPATTLEPHLQREVDVIAQRQERETQAQRDAGPSGGPDASGPSGGPGSTSNSRLQIERAPSSTEPRPIRAIPVPEEFVRLPKRDWDPNRKYWAAAATCHLPLYFQDAALERYGYSVEQHLGPVGRFLSIPLDDPRQSKQRNQIAQPFFSMGLFAAQIALLPYNMLMDPPWEAEYDLGYYRPGDRVPTDVFYLPLTGIGPPLRGSNYGNPPRRGAAAPASRW